MIFLFETILQYWVPPKIWQILSQPYSYQIHILACQVEIRRRNGVYEQVSMQCKTRHSCENNKAQNFHQKPQQIPGESKSNSLLVYAWYQCQPMPLGQNKDSVCRQCCQTDKEHIQIKMKWRLYWCWWRMLVTKYVSDKFEMLRVF